MWHFIKSICTIAHLMSGGLLCQEQKLPVGVRDHLAFVAVWDLKASAHDENSSGDGNLGHEWE